METGNRGNLSRFKREVEARARKELEATNPRYVEAFHQYLTTTGDLDKAIQEAKPLLGSGLPIWPKVLTAILDLELVLDKVVRSLKLLSMTPVGPSDIWSPGAWVVYHEDHWTFQMHAMFERLEKLVKLTARQLIRPRNRGWQKVQETLMLDVAKMQKSISRVRHPLAHGAGGGVTGVEEDQLWEAYLLRPEDMDVDIVAAHYQSVARFQQTWYRRLRRNTKTAVAFTEAILRELNKYAFQ